jgi:hypothetical protein
MRWTQLARLRWDFRAEMVRFARGFPGFLPRFLEHYWHGLDTEAWAHWVVEENGTVIAHMAVQAACRGPGSKSTGGWLTDCYDCRRAQRGHGSRLLAIIREWPRRRLRVLLVSPGAKSVAFYSAPGSGPPASGSSSPWIRLRVQRNRARKRLIA